MFKTEYKEVLGWCSMLSQTGGDLVDICKKNLIKPSLIITNNISKIKEENLNFFITNLIPIFELNRNPKSAQEYIQLLNKFKVTFKRRIKFITLNGFLRILPKEVISEVNGQIFNLHPGLITEYPELKGKDPQIRTYENLNKYKEVGCVLHRVIPEVDEGEILFNKKISTKEINSLDDLFFQLKNISIELWSHFFQNFLMLKSQK